jgi:Tol biopolymer transport system component
LVYVSLDPISGASDLWLANADGTDAQVIQLDGAQAPAIKDAPFFSPDGQSIIFSAPSPAQAYQPNWLDKVMGVQIVKAHSVPSDWWSVPVTGGVPKRLTQIQSTNLFARMSPDNQHVISFSMQGLFVMDLDGSNLTSLLPDSGGSTVDWLP